MEHATLSSTPWAIESARISLFGPQPADLASCDWWKTLTQSAPEITEIRAQTGERTDTGPFLDGQLVLHVSHNKVDWVLARPIDFADPDANLGPFPTPVNALVNAISPWLQSSAPVTRVALGIVAFMTASSREEGYDFLSRFLPNLGLVGGPVSDLNFQINRPRQYTSLGGESFVLNRLSKWNIRRIQMSWEMMAAGEGARGRPVGSATINRVTAELDLSSDAHRTDSISESNALELLGVFIRQATEILENGDIP